MLLETYDWGIDPRVLQILFGLALGAAFGVAAQISRFCLRRAVVGKGDEGRSAAAVWLTALGVAMAAFALASQSGWLTLGDHRFLSSQVPVAAILAGGLMFGVGMVLTRGCISRLTVLSASGNLRAMVVIAVFALVAHATLKGVLAPMRTALGWFQIDLPIGALSEISYLMPALAVLVLGLAVALARRSGARWRDMALGGIVGLVAVGGWATTSFLLYDEFDPMMVQSAAFTLPWTDTLFWAIASTAVPAGFGVGFVGGVLGGSFLSAALRNELALSSIETPTQTLRYVSGGALMGVGGVLAGGCTVGAGLSGSASGSIAALLALTAIILGGWATDRVMASRALPIAA